jgi:acyl carrier protein
LRRDLAERIHALPHVRRVLNLYGPSEDTTYSTWSEVEPGEDLPVTIGRPVAGTRARVVDEGLRPVGGGVPGELCRAGAGLARGYLGRPARTAASFVPDPFAPKTGDQTGGEAGAGDGGDLVTATGGAAWTAGGAEGRVGGGAGGGRLYRTGDLARWLPDGRLEFLGRLDHQVKLRGFRIELGVVETALAALPGVVEAVALLWRAPAAGGEEDGDPRLVAWWTAAPHGAAEAATAAAAGDHPTQPPERPAAEAAAEPTRAEPSTDRPARPPEQPATADDLAAALGRTLPAYMVPAHFVRLDRLPKTPNGKVDRKALPPPDPGREHAGGRRRDAEPPRTPVERRLAALWTEVLPVDSLGVHEDFFALGGHSLLASRLVARVRERFGVDLELRSLFQGPTVAALAAAIEERRAAGSGAAAGGGDRGDGEPGAIGRVSRAAYRRSRPGEGEGTAGDAD